MIIGISGKKGSGKDTVGLIISYLRYRVDYANYCEKNNMVNNLLSYDKIQFFNNFCVNYKSYTEDKFKYWQIKKYANKLKEIGCLILGCTMQDWENREFKEKELGEEWWTYHINLPSIYKGRTPSKRMFISKQEVEQFCIEHLEPKLVNHIVVKKNTPRKLIQLLGTEGARDLIHPNIWVNALMVDYNYGCDSQFCLGTCSKDCDEDAQPVEDWIIPDVRFHNEVKAIKDRDGLVIRINRDIRKTSEEWQKKFPDVVVYDPDGWDRKNWEYSWEEELITLEEYKSRLSRSTCICKGNIGASWSDYIKLDEHPSETALDDYKDFDYVIDNNGTIEELIEKVKTILEKENLL